MTVEPDKQGTKKSPIELHFDEFCQAIVKKLPNVDTELVIRTLLLEASLKEDHPSRSKPHLNLYVYYKDGIDLDEKSHESRDKYPIQIAVSRWNDGLVMSGLVNMKNLETIASDPDVVKIKLKAFTYSDNWFDEFFHNETCLHSIKLVEKIETSAQNRIFFIE